MGGRGGRRYIMSEGNLIGLKKLRDEWFNNMVAAERLIASRKLTSVQVAECQRQIQHNKQAIESIADSIDRGEQDVAFTKTRLSVEQLIAGEIKKAASG